MSSTSAEEESMRDYRTHRPGTYQEMTSGFRWERPGELQPGRRRARQARARPPGHALRVRRGPRRALELRRHPAAHRPHRQHPAGAGGRQGGPGGGDGPGLARDRGQLPGHLQGGGDPALHVGAVRRRLDRVPAERLRGQGAGDLGRPPRPGGGPARQGAVGRAPGGGGRRRRRELRGADRGGLRPLRDPGHRPRHPGPALLHLGHHRAGQGHPACPPLPARARGVPVQPRRPGG